MKAVLQAGHVKDDPNPDAFLPVPAAYVTGPTWGARLRLLDLCLSVLLWHARTSRSRSTLAFTDGTTVEVGEGTFAVSMQTVAEVIGARLYGHAGRDWIEDEEGEWTEGFREWYRRVETACDTLCRRGVIHKLGNPGGRRFNGTLWTFQGTDLLAYVLEEATPETVDVVEEAHSVFLDTEDAARFRVQECCTDVRNRGLYADGQGFRESVERHAPSQDRHQSVGAWRPEGVSAMGPDEAAPVAVPWVPLDVDREDLVEAYEATNRVLSEIEGWDADALEHVRVVYTGGDGFHVRIPSGLLGNPVYADAESAHRTLTRFAQTLTEEDLDTQVLSPRHLVRMVGSRHRSGRYCVAFSVAQFRELHLGGIVGAAEVPEGSVALPSTGDPMEAPRSEALASLLREVGEQPFWVPRYEDVPERPVGTGAALRALEGCEEGEAWWPGHVGRSKLVYVAACHLLRTESSEEAAWAETQAVAGRCSPALPPSETRACFNSARRTVAKD